MVAEECNEFVLNDCPVERVERENAKLGIKGSVSTKLEKEAGQFRNVSSENRNFLAEVQLGDTSTVNGIPV